MFLTLSSHTRKAFSLLPIHLGVFWTSAVTLAVPVSPSPRKYCLSQNKGADFPCVAQSGRTSGQTRPHICCLVWQKKWKDPNWQKLLSLAHNVVWTLATQKHPFPCFAQCGKTFEMTGFTYVAYSYRKSGKTRIAISCSVMETMWSLATKRHPCPWFAQSDRTCEKIRLHICCQIWQNKWKRKNFI